MPHPDIIKRLKRADGRLRGVIAMIEGGKPCLDAPQQLPAIKKPVSYAKRTLIQDHLDNCLEAVVGPQPRERRRPINEFKQIAKYL